MTGARWRDLAGLAAAAVGTYAVVLLFDTPRGDRILDRVDRVLFPPWLTGEPPRPRPCCCCGSAEVVYRNYREQPFCGPCADGEGR